jgi:hypothetical protein
MIPNLMNVVKEEYPAILHPNWQKIKLGATNTVGESRMVLKVLLSGLKILYSVSTVEENKVSKRFHHVSFSRADRIPSWEEMSFALYNEVPWLRDTEPVIMVLPPAGDYVSLPNSKVMHWWQECRRIDEVR